MIDSSMKTKIDVARQTQKFHLQANLLLRNFRHPSDEVKSTRSFRHIAPTCLVVRCGSFLR